MNQRIKSSESQFYLRGASRGEGPWIILEDGRRILDCGVSYFTAPFGHSWHTALLEKWKGLLSSGLVVSDVVEEFKSRLKLILPKEPVLLEFRSTGALAVEAAVEMAMKIAEKDRREMLVHSDGFYGCSTYLTKSLSSMDGFGEKSLVYRGKRYSISRKPYSKMLGALDTGKFAFCLIEPICGAGGIIVPSPLELASIEKAARKNSTILIYDEIQCGLGRTGEAWAHASMSGPPDILLAGKNLGGGIPMAMVSVFKTGVNEFYPPSTYDLNPLGSYLGIEVLKRLPRDMAYVKRSSAELFSYYRGLAEMRGKGYMIGFEYRGSAVPVRDEMLRRGYGMVTGGRANNVLRLEPPLSTQVSNMRKLIDELISVETDLRLRRI